MGERVWGDEEEESGVWVSWGIDTDASSLVTSYNSDIQAADLEPVD